MLRLLFIAAACALLCGACTKRTDTAVESHATQTSTRTATSSESDDRARLDLAMQLVADNIDTPDSAGADEGRRLLEQISHLARSEEQRFDAALLRLKFSKQEERDRLAEDILKRFAAARDLEQVYYFLVDASLADGDTAGAAKHARALLERFPHTDEEAMYRDIVERAALIGAEMPLDARDKSRIGPKLRGRVVVFDFWATWCAPCIAEVPRLREFWEKNRGRGFEIVGVNVDEDRAAFEAFVEEEHIAWPMIRSRERTGGVADRCRITALPTYIVVGRDGRIRSIDARGAALYAMLERLLSEK